jgi:hypothetical protein
VAGRMISTEKSNNLVGNRNRYLSASSIVPQSTKIYNNMVVTSFHLKSPRWSLRQAIIAVLTLRFVQLI